MKANIGSADRVVRVIVGLVILVAGIFCRSWWGLIGLIPLLTAVVRYCPLYAPFKITTCKAEGEKPEVPPGGPKPA